MEFLKGGAIQCGSSRPCTDAVVGHVSLCRGIADLPIWCPADRYQLHVDIRSAGLHRVGIDVACCFCAIVGNGGGLQLRGGGDPGTLVVMTVISGIAFWLLVAGWALLVIATLMRGL